MISGANKAIRGTGSVGGPPRSLHRFFGEASVLRLVAVLFFILAVILICIGVFTIIFPIAIVGFAAALAASGFDRIRKREKCARRVARR